MRCGFCSIVQCAFRFDMVWCASLSWMWTLTQRGVFFLLHTVHLVCVTRCSWASNLGAVPTVGW
jgi:hypothetical protein